MSKFDEESWDRIGPLGIKPLDLVTFQRLHMNDWARYAFFLFHSLLSIQVNRPNGGTFHWSSTAYFILCNYPIYLNKTRELDSTS